MTICGNVQHARASMMDFTSSQAFRINDQLEEHVTDLDTDKAKNNDDYFSVISV